MSTFTFELKMPESLRDLGCSAEEICREVPILLVLKRFRQGAISSSRAAHILNLSRRDFLELLAREGTPLLDPYDQQFALELKTVGELKTFSKNIVISDSTPLIYLSAVGRFELFQMLYGQLRIPVAVHKEVIEHGAGRWGAAETASARWIECRPAVMEQSSLPEHLNGGEKEGIARRLTYSSPARSADSA